MSDRPPAAAPLWRLLLALAALTSSVFAVRSGDPEDFDYLSSYRRGLKDYRRAVVGQLKEAAEDAEAELRDANHGSNSLSEYRPATQALEAAASEAVPGSSLQQAQLQQAQLRRNDQIASEVAAAITAGEAAGRNAAEVEGVIREQKERLLLKLLGAEGYVRRLSDDTTTTTATTTMEPIGPKDEKMAESCGAGMASGPEWKCTHEDRRADCKLSNDTEDRGCGRNQTRCDGDLFEDSRADNGSFIPCCEKHNLQLILEMIDKALCGYVQYSIMYGTLLAAVREKDLIDWDTDIDIIIFEGEDKDKAQKLLAAQAGDFYFSMSEAKDDAARVYWGHENHIHADIWFVYEEGNCTKAEEWHPNEWLAKPFDRACELQGKKFSCPRESEKILDYLYGSRHNDSRSWKNVSAGNDKGRSLHCKEFDECNVEEHGFSCGGSKRSASVLESSADGQELLTGEAAAKRWFPSEPDWARRIRLQASSVEERNWMEDEHLHPHRSPW